MPRSGTVNFANSNRRATTGQAGAAGEYLVASDLLARGFPVTKPLDAQGKDDLHVKVGGKWRNVQVKLGSVSKKTGHIYKNNATKVVSEILAVVDLKGRRIRYLSTTTQSLPRDLKT